MPVGHLRMTVYAVSSPSRRLGRPHPPTSAFSAAYSSCLCLGRAGKGSRTMAEGGGGGTKNKNGWNQNHPNGNKGRRENIDGG